MTQTSSDSSTSGDRPTALPVLRDSITDAIRYWEVRRVFYNTILAFIVLGHVIAAWPGSRSAFTIDSVLGLFLLAVLANVAFCSVYLADVFIQFSGFRASRFRWRWVFVAIGFAFAAVLTHFWAGSLVRYPGGD
jgi:hypothetical protein